MIRNIMLFLGFFSCCFTISAQAQTILFQEGASCTFFKGFQAPPDNWTQPEFDPQDGNWESGTIGIGYGDDDDATILDDMMNNYIAVFVRISFEAPQGIEDFFGAIHIRYDDGFVAYIDGKEIARRGLAGIPPAFDEPADPNHEITDPAGFDETILIQDNLLNLSEGTHVFAVEVHNRALDSSDLSFSAQLDVFPFIANSMEPEFGSIQGGKTIIIHGAGFKKDEIPSVSFGSKPSNSVTVVDTENLEVVVPAGDVQGPVTVELEDSRGAYTIPQTFLYTSSDKACLSFNTSQMAHAEGLGEFPEEGTFELWFRRTTSSRRVYMCLFSVESEEGGDDSFRVEARTNRLRLSSNINGNFNNLYYRGDTTTDWHYLAITFSEEGRKIYFDGALTASDNIVMTIPEDVHLRLGQSFGNTTGFAGQMFSMKVWNVERTEEEINRDQYLDKIDSPFIVASWPMHKGAGSIAENTAPSGNPLILGDTTESEANDPEWIHLDDFSAFAVTGININSGPLEGGGLMEIYGAGFSEENRPEVMFGPNPAASVGITSENQLAVIVPAGDKYETVDITIDSPDGTITLPNAYSYVPDSVYSFVREGDNWYYYTNNSGPIWTWKTIDFDPEEAGWPSGPTGIGYGDGDDATLVPEMQTEGYITLYARTTWEMVGDGSDIYYLKLLIRYDDGFVAYLNGQEIARANIAGDIPAFDEPASELHEITGGPGEFDDQFDLSDRVDLLRKGTNILAIEVHNYKSDSSDLSLSAELDYSAPGAAFIRGDATRDGRISIADCIMILRGLFGEAEISCMEAYDYNDDDKLRISDAVDILTYLFLDGKPPAAPFPQPMVDMDDDLFDCRN